MARTVVSTAKYRSRENKDNRFVCYIRILFCAPPDVYHYEIVHNLEQVEKPTLNSYRDGGFETETDAMRSAERAAEEHLDHIYINDTQHIHQWFSLSYANYLVLPRTLLEAMPGEWQLQFVELMEEMNQEFDYLDSSHDYEVKLRVLIDETTEGNVYQELDDPLANYKYPPSLTLYRRKTWQELGATLFSLEEVKSWNIEEIAEKLRSIISQPCRLLLMSSNRREPEELRFNQGSALGYVDDNDVPIVRITMLDGHSLKNPTSTIFGQNWALVGGDRIAFTADGRVVIEKNDRHFRCGLWQITPIKEEERESHQHQ